MIAYRQYDFNRVNINKNIFMSLFDLHNFYCLFDLIKTYKRFEHFSLILRKIIVVIVFVTWALNQNIQTKQFDAQCFFRPKTKCKN